MRNKKGFTLIEIIVSIMIASIGMMIAATIILNSMGYFDKTAVADHDKQALDGIKDYFQNELIYASEVKIANVKPEGDDWHWLYVKNDVLYRDNDFGNSEDIKVYLDEFYNRKKLKITARGYDKYRLILNFYLNNDDNKTIYKTATTIELLNFKEQINKETEGISPFSKEGNTVDLDNSSSTYKIYYKKGEIAINAQEEDKKKCDVNNKFPTVFDELCERDSEISIPKTTNKPNEEGTNTNNKGFWDDNLEKYGDMTDNRQYFPGDFIELENGEIWRLVWVYGDIKNTSKPGTTHEVWWKKIDEVWDGNSFYEKDDVVKYKDRTGYEGYFKCKIQFSNYSPPDEVNIWTKVVKDENNGGWIPAN